MISCLNEEDKTLLTTEDKNNFVCPIVPYGKFKMCPKVCKCSFNNSTKSITIDCSNQNLTRFPEIIQSSKDQEQIVLLLRNNHIETLPKDLVNKTITHLDLSNNKIKTINESQLPWATLETLILQNNFFENISDLFLDHLRSKKINFSVFNNPLTCSYENLKIIKTYVSYSMDSHISENHCMYSSLQIRWDVVSFVHDDLYPLMLVLFLMVFIPACLIWKKRGSRRISEDKLYDAFISYSHQDAFFAEQVLYPGLKEEGIKCCIHTVHWQVHLLIFAFSSKSRIYNKVHKRYFSRTYY